LGNILFHIIYLKDVSSAEEAQLNCFAAGKIKPDHVVFKKLYVRTHALALFPHAAAISDTKSLISNLIKLSNKNNFFWRQVCPVFRPLLPYLWSTLLDNQILAQFICCLYTLLLFG